MNNSAASRGSTPSNTASTSGSCSENASRRLSLDILEHSIEDVLCCLSEKGLRCKVLESGMKLKDIVQPLSSDFSKFFECISDGAKTISDQKSSSSKLSSEAQSAALDAVKVLGNVHWVAVGLLAIANVLERFEKISANDRDCMDLLKAMLDLAKFLKQLKDMNAEIHKEISEKMMEALRLIVTGSILCRSFTRHKKMLKFLYTAKIRDELVYIRRKVDGIIGQLSLQLQLKIASSYMSQQPQYTVSGEIQNACEIEISPAESDNDRTPQELELSKSNSIHDVLSEQNFSGDKTPQRHMLVRIFPRLCSYLQKLRHREFQGREKDTRTRSALKLCHRHRKFQGREKDTRTRSALQLCQSHLLSFNGTLDAFRIPMQFTVEELERATEKFRLSVASDFYSESWKGTLSNGKQVMVKRMRNDKALEKTDTEMLVNELTCMLNFFHRNILKLVGYCITEKEETLLVYDYMPNGNLGHFLFGTDCMKSGILDWSTRVQIATGTARGIQYLHEECSVQILHCDIKPQNILLDNIYNPKISEFGLAELLMEEQTPTITRARGTMGYIAPEWFKNMPITAKVDVYSFGVMLLEIICCRKTLALDVPEVEIILSDWIYKCLKDGALNKLVEQQQAEGITIDSSQLERMVLVGLWCIQEDPILRPSMKRVVQMLEGTVDIAVPPPPPIFYC